MIPREENGPRLIPAFDLINVVQKIEESISFDLPNGRVQQGNNDKSRDANEKGRKLEYKCLSLKDLNISFDEHFFNKKMLAIYITFTLL